jgi:monoamine oxidase
MARTALSHLLSRALHQVRRSESLGQPLDEIVEREAERAKTRRNFLKGAAAVGAALALPNFGTAGEISVSAKRKPVVVIVGGGTAGLTCAYRLKQRGIIANVYEATSRTGGRMFSDRTTFGYAGQTCELGGELIDTGHATMRRMAAEFGLTLEDKHDDIPGLADLVGFFNGRNIPYRELLTEFTPIAKAIDRSRNRLTVPDNGISYGDPNGGAWLDALSLSEWFDRNHLSGIGRKLVEVAHVIEWGLDADEMNAYDMIGLISTDTKHIGVFGDSDERFHISGGNDQIPKALAERLPNQIATGQVLQRIRQQADGRYALAFTSGTKTTEVVADHVVSAIPFKLLREVELCVDLPCLKQIAINELGYGQNSKTMTGFSSRPWRAQGSDGQSFSDLSFQNSWDTSQMQPGAHGILTEYTGGSPAITAGNGTTPAHAATFVGQINRVYPGCSAAYTGKAVRMAWNRMPFNRASYSAYLVGQYTRFASTEGEAVGNLHFAGEHTDFEHQGYMEGAAVSGERTAQEVLTALGIPALSAAG